MDGFENRKKFAVMERGQSYERAGQNVSGRRSEARCCRRIAGRWGVAAWAACPGRR